MAVNYFPDSPILFDELFDGRLKALGVTEAQSEESKPDARPLTDGQNVLWMYRDRDGHSSATRYGLNDVTLILSAIERAFGVAWIDELDEDLNGDN
jgi:hypothetical protein